MKTIVERKESWVAKAIAKNPRYFAVAEKEGKMFYIGQLGLEPILSFYALADVGTGMKEYYAYDTYTAEHNPPKAFTLVVNVADDDDDDNNSRMILSAVGQKHQVFGFAEEMSKNDDTVEKEHPFLHVMIYMRTPQYHTFIFCDREHNDMKIMGEIAHTDANGNASPDAITVCMVSMHKGNSAGEVNICE